MLLHRNLVANMLQVEAWNQPMVDAPPKIDRLIIVTALPLYHIFALDGVLPARRADWRMCLLIPNPRDIRGLIKELSHYKVNMFPAVNTLVQCAAESTRFRQDRLEHAQMRDRRRHGGSEIRRRCLGESHRQSRSSKATACPETSPVLTVQPRRHHRMDRHHRIAGAFDRDFDPRR